MSERRYGPLADRIALKYGLDPRLFRRLITAESGWNPNAGSPAGARGLAQLMPGTARGLGVRNITDPRQNLEGGAKYLSQQMKRFKNPKLALAAYNAGPGAVERYGGVPPYSETRNYVEKILSGYTPGNASGAGVPPAPAPGGAPSVNRPSIDGAKLLELLSQTSRGALQGRMPGPEFAREFFALAQDASRAPSVRQVQRSVARDVQANVPSGPFDGTYGFPTGPVDSGRVVPGGQGGDWGGSMPRALHLAKAVGANPTSQKRSRVRTRSGNVSDHYAGASSSYAIDLPYTGSAGDAKFRQVMQYLARLSGNPSIARLQPGRWHNITINGYRYQVGWKADDDHFDHIHIGVRKL